MNWSYTVPTEPGIYWRQPDCQSAPVIALVHLTPDGVSWRRVGADSWYDASFCPVGRWSPRIEAPKGDEPWEPSTATQPEPPPVDRSARQLVSGQPVPADQSHTELKNNGQQQDYVVLTPEERAKGFVRPVRCAYQHVGPSGPKNPMRDLTPEENERYADFGYVQFEAYPSGESCVTGRFWTQAQLLAKGCGAVTTMSRALAETYARDPKFYGGTFCCGCGKHLPVDEFVWDGTDERVGS